MVPAPSAKDVHATMKSALAARLEGIHELPHFVLLANRDKRGQWGKVNVYYAYCHKCCRWFAFDAARMHSDCSGWNWDSELNTAAWQWWPEIEKMSDRVQRGQHPYYEGVHDRRTCDAAVGSVFPALVAGQRQLVRAPLATGLSSQLEVMVDIPSLDSADSNPGPLKVLMYFHGHGGEDCEQAPASFPGCVVVAVQCPTHVTEGLRCFWFTEGPGGAWDRHEHTKLRRCDALLGAVADLLDSVLSGLAMLKHSPGIKQEVMLVGVSMGGAAVLAFARAFPSRICAAAVIAGCYDDAQIGELSRATAEIPFLLVHSRGDQACPFRTIEKLYLERTKDIACSCKQNAETEAQFSDGKQHTPTTEELLAAIEWVLRHA